MGNGGAVPASDLPENPPIPQAGQPVPAEDLPGAFGAPSASKTGAPQPSIWRSVYDATTELGQLHAAVGAVADWAGRKAQAKQTAEEAAPEAPEGIHKYISARAGYDLLARTAGLVHGLLDPVNLAITGGVIAANLNPFTGIPVDAALVAHGGYTAIKNAPEALKGNPEAAAQALFGTSEAAGGAAGVGVQFPAALTRVRAIFGPAAAPATHEVVGGASGPEAEPDGAPGAPGVGRIARTLGITDPPPHQLLTKAIKPLASNFGWDRALAKAAPVIKGAEADLGHPITGLDDMLEATGIAKKLFWRRYATKLEQARAVDAGPLQTRSATSGQFQAVTHEPTIDGNAVADAMMDSIDPRTRLQHPEIVDRVKRVADTYRRPMQLDEAEDFLQSVNKELNSYYAKNKVGRRVAEADPATASTVAEGDQLRDSLYSKIDELTGSGAGDLKDTYGSLTNVELELMRRKNVAARQQPESLAEQIAMARAYGKIAVGTLRLDPSSMMEGVQSLAAAKWLKARSTTDAMIMRAFQTLGRPPAAPAVPRPAPSVAPGAVGAIAGMAKGERQ